MPCLHGLKWGVHLCSLQQKILNKRPIFLRLEITLGKEKSMPIDFIVGSIGRSQIIKTLSSSLWSNVYERMKFIGWKQKLGKEYCRPTTLTGQASSLARLRRAAVSMAGSSILPKKIGFAPIAFLISLRIDALADNVSPYFPSDLCFLQNMDNSMFHLGNT